MRVKIISGANLNILGRREKIYGDFSYEEMEKQIADYCEKIGAEPEFFISNHEGELVEAVQNTDCPLIINAGAYSHYSLAIADALRCLSTSKIEVHLTNIHARGRHESVVAAATDGAICGLGIKGYFLALDYILTITDK